ncbi:hypothetical protein Ais01nite_80870 [Asanoa ishikariensis]|uniref:Uncharacterized protein n=1 Tax=Asanoa ishikariensis TaxID=137265 RepID=A0A1H3V047_9ACTN|nr:hypothetical protein [Asanoa ishikariensis]GIF70052.1 hypothetical protein Ais01nite_80870 [Asanoa ishikariensis]SDZ67405.1 hypothetical protein SAMN05421684_8430 [Asanoa ishikariensis]
MSYDITIAAHRALTVDLVEAWAAERSCSVRREPDHLVVVPPSGKAPIEVWGPDPAEADDFEEALAAACLAPRWMVEVTTTATAPKATIAMLRNLARHLAEHTDGAAFDTRQDGLIWPRGVRKSTVAAGERQTSMLTLDWFVAPSRWARAAGELVDLLARLCPEALPTRYGEWEPPPHRFDREPFTRAVLDTELLWRATRPCFGGSAHPPHDGGRPVGRITLNFDGGLIRADDRWRDVVVDLFTAGARRFGAFFAAAQDEPGQVVSRNSIWSTTGFLSQRAEHILRGRDWQGLPPVPMWLSWYGDPYASLVSPGLVRLSEDPRSRADLPEVVPPAEPTYRHRPPFVDAHGSTVFEPAQPEDRAPHIPELES